jgi:hypothetical protein
MHANAGPLQKKMIEDEPQIVTDLIEVCVVAIYASKSHLDKL